MKPVISHITYNLGDRARRAQDKCCNTVWQRANEILCLAMPQILVAMPCRYIRNFVVSCDALCVLALVAMPCGHVFKGGRRGEGRGEGGGGKGEGGGREGGRGGR